MFRVRRWFQTLTLDAIEDEHYRLPTSNVSGSWS